MNHDYLWDGSGEPDPEIQKLEMALAPLRYKGSAPEFDRGHEPVEQPRLSSLMAWRIGLAFACASVALAGLWWYLAAAPSYEVVSLAGAPQVGVTRLSEKGQLKIGQWLQTDSSSRARIQVGLAGQVDIEPGTRIKLVQAQANEHRLLLERGTLHATIWAPPRLFYVDTPFAEAEDLGCAYTLEVAEDGTGFLQVTSGWVAFKHQGRESFVPAGAACRTYPSQGPGTPYRLDAAPALQSALDTLDRGSDATGLSLATVLSMIRPEDAFTLWHLLTRTRGSDQARICSRLAQLVPMPAGVDRQGILTGDTRMLDRWWNALGLGDAGWWRLWERPWQDRK